MAAVWLRVRIDVVPGDPEAEVPEPEATTAAQEAVYTAKEAEQEGLEHEHADRFALSVDYVEVIDFDASA